ncbi:MAG TPA: hypothetical protein VD866_17895 [Urbifossiella sp.]|nr:hypothetical protein [Urbifossiella sp.]
MRAELVRLGVTDPAILGESIMAVKGGRVESMVLTAADEPDYKSYVEKGADPA